MIFQPSSEAIFVSIDKYASNRIGRNSSFSTYFDPIIEMRLQFSIFSFAHQLL